MIRGPLAAIISTSIATAGLAWAILFGIGAFEKNHAIVEFDGGYTRLGVINEERIFSSAEIKKDGQSIKSGDFKEVIGYLKALDGSESITASLASGITISGSVGIKWDASRTSFTLTTDQFERTSTDAEPVLVIDVIAQMQTMLLKEKADREETAKRVLTFGKDPASNFADSLVSALRR